MLTNYTYNYMTSVVVICGFQLPLKKNTFLSAVSKTEKFLIEILGVNQPHLDYFLWIHSLLIQCLAILDVCKFIIIHVAYQCFYAFSVITLIEYSYKKQV